MPSIDMCLVAHIVHGGSISAIRDHGVQAEALYDESRKVFEYVMVHFGKHGKVPDTTTIENDTKIKIPPPFDIPEPITYYIERVKERALDKLVMESTKAQTAAMDKLNTKGALNSVKRLLTDINRLNLAGEPVDDWTLRTDERWAAFRAAARFQGGVTGLPTPWPGINQLTKGMQLGDFWLIVGRPKAGKCVAEGTRIPDPETGRVLRIEDVIARKGKVWTFDFDGGIVKSITPTDWIVTGTKSCIRLGTRLGRAIVATPEHPLLTSRGWVRADELSLSDRIVSAARIPEPEFPREMPEAEIDFLAVMLSEGSFSGHHVGFTTADPKFLEIAERAAGALGMQVSPQGNLQFDFVGRRSDNGAKSISRYLLKKHGFVDEKAKEKWLPDAIFSLPNEQLKRFLTIFWMADGYITDNPGIGLASERLIDDLQILLLRFGIVAKKRYKPAKCDGKPFDSWVLEVDAWCRKKFRETFQDMPGEKGDWVRSLRDPEKTNVDVVDVSDGMKQVILGAAAKYRKWDCTSEERRGLFSETAKRLGSERGSHWGSREFIDKHGTGRVSRRKLTALVEEADGLLDDIEWMTSTDIVFDKIVSIEDAGERRVFDLSVEGTHNFIAEGIVCHNSWELFDMAIHSWLTPIPLDFDDTGNVTASRPAKVLTITTEMLKEDVKERMDAIYSKLSYTGIVSGTLGMHIEDQYKIALDGLKGKNPLWIVTRKRVKDIQDVPIIVEEMQPDIVFLDGLYKLKVEGARFKSTWEKVTEIADELDLIAKTKGTIIVGTTQFNRGAVKTGGKKAGKKIPMAGLENLAFADALGMNPDVVLGVISSKDMKENNEAILQLIANRRGKEGAWLCNFNPDQGEFGEISAVDEGMDADADEGGDEGDVSVDF